MIGVNGQFFLNFKVGGKNGFITDLDDLIKFSIIERAGNILPQFILTFYTRDEGIFPLLNETNDLEVSFGESKDNLDDMTLNVLKLNSLGSSGGVKELISVTGCLSKIEYLSYKKLASYKNLSGVEALKEVVSQHFTPVFNIERSEDKQTWIQPSWTDRRMIQEIWLHSYLSKSFIACGITSNSEFILKDMKKNITDYAFKFTQNPESSKDIPYDSDLTIECTTGFINNWVGYGQEMLVENTDTGQKQLASAEIQPIIALTDQVVKNAKIAKRRHSTKLVNSNVHENYWLAYVKNITLLASLSSVRVQLSFQKRFPKIKLLDLVMLKVDGLNTQGSSEYRSGLYYVSKIVKTISNKQIVVIVDLVRESFNFVKGDYLSPPVNAGESEFSISDALSDDEVDLT